MKSIIVAALLAALTAPSLARAADVADAVTTLSAIQKDETKRKAYCEMQDLLVEAEEASHKNEDEQAKVLSEKAEAKSNALGEEFQKLTAADADIDPTSEDGKKFLDAWEALEKSCRQA